MNCPICGELLPEQAIASRLFYFYRCPHCRGFYHKENTQPQYKEEYFVVSENGKPARIFQRLIQLPLWLKKRRVQKLVSKDQRILDYGCGSGKLVDYLLKSGFLVEGYDPSPSAVTLAQQQFLPVLSAIPRRQYDLIMFWHSLEHTDQPLLDLQKIKDHCSFNGKLLIAVPNGDSWESQVFGKTWFCYDWPFHRVHFTPDSLKKLLEKAGFRTTAINYWNPEYTITSLMQTFLNLILPKNFLYSLVTSRRQEFSILKVIFWGTASLFLLIPFSPFLAIFFLGELLFGRTAAFIVTAERKS